jgi:hypothetical protein
MNDIFGNADILNTESIFNNFNDHLDESTKQYILDKLLQRISGVGLYDHTDKYEDDDISE